jgi:hypothetical protein
MSKSGQEDETLFRPGKASWLKNKGVSSLTPEQRALLLALAQLESALGRDVSDEEWEALESLTKNMHGFDPQDVARAVKQMIEAPTDPERALSWPELKRNR